VSTHRRRALSRFLIVTALLLPIGGCAGVDRIEGGAGLLGEGAIAGRVELFGSATSARASDGRPTAVSGLVFVYLEPLDPSHAALSKPSTPEVRIGAGRQDPQLVLVHPNQAFHFLNLDAIHHEAFSLDAPNDFRVRIGGHQPSEPIRLPQSGFIRVFCELHPTETFSLIVSPAEHVVAVGSDGSFAIANVRSGHYRVRAAGVDAESATFPVVVSRGATLKLQLSLSPRAAK